MAYNYFMCDDFSKRRYHGANTHRKNVSFGRHNTKRLRERGPNLILFPHKLSGKMEIQACKALRLQFAVYVTEKVVYRAKWNKICWGLFCFRSMCLQIRFSDAALLHFLSSFVVVIVFLPLRRSDVNLDTCAHWQDLFYAYQVNPQGWTCHRESWG